MRFGPESFVELKELVWICTSVDSGEQFSAYLAKSRGTHSDALSAFRLIAV
jgi:hypothetical protein